MRQRVLRVSSLLVTALAALAMAGTAAAHKVNFAVERDLNLPNLATSAPDLVTVLPDVSRDGIPGFYADTLEKPGRILYRFDTVIANQGGTLDLFCEPCGPAQRTYQMIWPNGRPPASDLPVPTAKPSAANLAGNTVQLLTDTTYSFASGHNHFHFDRAARYELLVGQAPIVADKIGFCLYDTYGGGNNEPMYFPGSAGNTNAYNWCAPGTGGSVSLTRMGVSPQRGDLYAAFLTDQWLDVTDVAPGAYTLRATVNPGLKIVESDIDNNLLEISRVVPGGSAASTQASTPAGVQVAIPLTGDVVGASVPSRKNTSCSLRKPDCFVTATPGALTWQKTSGPAFGGATVTGSGLTATATYTPAPGFSGTDTFTVRAIDSRGLAGPPATVTVHVGVSAPVPGAAPTISGDAVVGQTLTASPGAWTGTAPIATAIAWQRCDLGGTACFDVPGANGGTYQAAAADVGARLRVKVVATNAAGSTEATSAPTVTVAAAPPPPSPPPPAEQLPVSDAATPTVLELAPPTPPRTPARTYRRGSAARNVLTGTNGPDSLRGLGGDDRVAGLGGADLLFGGRGEDRISGGSGRDRLDGGPGHDVLVAADGAADQLSCGGGSDVAVVDSLDSVDASCETVLH